MAASKTLGGRFVDAIIILLAVAVAVLLPPHAFEYVVRGEQFGSLHIAPTLMWLAWLLFAFFVAGEDAMSVLQGAEWFEKGSFRLQSVAAVLSIPVAALALGGVVAVFMVALVLLGPDSKSSPATHRGHGHVSETIEQHTSKPARPPRDMSLRRAR